MKTSLLPHGVRVRRSTVAVLVAGSIVAGLLACSMPASLQNTTNTGPALAVDAPPTLTLERAFWYCDYVATKQLVDLGMAGQCSAVTDALQRTKFGGDFDALLAWWQQNKASEHAALEQAASE